MATHRMDVSVRFGAPDLLEAKVEAAEVPLRRVPDVRLRSEMSAIVAIARAGLVPGQRSPRPRPACGTPEVVIRTFPRGGTLVRRGTRVDYELLPGVPREGATMGSDDGRHESHTLDRPSRRPADERA
jgi:hypothetical protein